MKRSILLIIFLFCSAADGFNIQNSALAQIKKPKTRMHTSTDWRIEPSFTFDTLCFLNVLTGDPFYVDYYKDEYVQFEPQLTPAARTAFANLKRKIKDENKGIISAFLALYLSAADDKSLGDLLQTLRDSSVLKRNLMKTPYYSEQYWQLFESVKPDLQTVFLFLKAIDFENYWKQNILPKIQLKIAEIRRDLPRYNVVAEVEQLLGFKLPLNKLTVYLLNYSKPHGIRITGLRFLTNVDYPFAIVMRNAVHEPMHPPYNLKRDSELKAAIGSLQNDAFLMDKVNHHNPSFGYNTLEGFIEEDCVQALEQIINEKLKVEVEAHKYWNEQDNGMHVFAVALYSVIKEEHFDGRRETFRNFLVRMIRSGKLKPGGIKQIHDDFYSKKAV